MIKIEPDVEYTAILRNSRRSRLYRNSVEGTIQGDRKFRFRDGEWVISSTIVSESPRLEDGSCIIQTKNSVYKVFFKDGEK